MVAAYSRRIIYNIIPDQDDDDDVVVFVDCEEDVVDDQESEVAPGSIKHLLHAIPWKTTHDVSILFYKYNSPNLTNDSDQPNIYSDLSLSGPC